jgi:hypothetical protein
MIKKKLLLFLVFLSAGFITEEVNAQSMVLKAKDGTETVRNLSTLQRLYFENNNLFLKNTGGTAESYVLTNISKIYFKSGTTVAEMISQNQGDQNILLYPNPVKNVFRLQNLPEGTFTIAIFRIDGTLVFLTQVTADKNAIDVSNLNKGIYLLKIRNQALKFAKL